VHVVGVGRMVSLGLRENMPLNWRFCGRLMFATVTALLVSSVAVFILFSKTNSFFSSAGMFYGASALGSTTNTKR
jgi:hypothetical protein